MDRIEISILNPSAVAEAERMMACAARLTQRGHMIQSMADFMALYEKSYTDATIAGLAALPHPTLQKFGTVNIAVVGASRRFLAQITRHQNEVKFMSASLQYSDYSGRAGYVVPYGLLGTEKEAGYLAQCEAAMQKYMSLIAAGADNDEAGYLMPHGLRSAMVISATPYQWKHMIRQRVCRRNTKETRYVMLLIWQALFQESEALFSGCGPSCMTECGCREGKMACGRSMAQYAGRTPADLIKADFPKLCG